MKNNSIIEVIPHDFDVTQARIDWAAVHGAEIPRPGVSFLNTVTGENYSYICGAVGWPSSAASGMLLVLAVDNSIESYPVIRCIDETGLPVDSVPGEMLKCILALREKYGFGLHPSLMTSWYGNPDKFANVDNFVKNKVFISSPSHQDKTNRFQIYLDGLRSALPQGKEDGKQSLVLANCHKTLSYMKSLPQDAQIKDGEALYPAVYALGAAYVSLRDWKLWLKAGDPSAYNLDDGYGE